jgi:hypothetical protein
MNAIHEIMIVSGYTVQIIQVILMGVANGKMIIH